MTTETQISQELAAPDADDSQAQPLLTQVMFEELIERERLNLARAEYLLRMLGRAFNSREEPIPADDAIEVLGVVVNVVRQAAGEATLTLEV